MHTKMLLTILLALLVNQTLAVMNVQNADAIVGLTARLTTTQQPLTDTIALLAFYNDTFAQPCEQAGFAGYLQAANATCYGPIGKSSSWNLISVDEGCQAFVRHSPCGVDEDATLMAVDGECYAAAMAPNHDLAIWVQCGVVPVSTDSLAEAAPAGTQTSKDGAACNC